MLNFMEQTARTPARRRPAESRVAIGCDDAGYALKELLKEHLHADGVSLSDLGTHSFEPADYTDYAHAVAELVAAKKSEFGVLICATASA